DMGIRSDALPTCKESSVGPAGRRVFTGVVRSRRGPRYTFTPGVELTINTSAVDGSAVDAGAVTAVAGSELVERELSSARFGVRPLGGAGLGLIVVALARVAGMVGVSLGAPWTRSGSTSASGVASAASLLDSWKEAGSPT